MKNLFALSIALVILFSAISYSQGIDDKSSTRTGINLNGTHSLYISAGFKMNSGTSANATVGEVKTETNFIGFLGYQYWFGSEWSVNFSAGLFSAESNVSFTNVSSISIIPILFGFSYYPEALKLGDAGRVHFGLNTGAYMGSGSKVGTSIFNIGTTSVNETVFGAEPNAGIDFFAAGWLRIGPEISYHIVSDFKEVIGKRKNYSGPVLSFNMGILL